jgi:transposase
MGSTDETTELASPAQQIVTALMDRGYSAMQIADLLDGRVSWRTIYRWAKGEAKPQRPSDEEALRELEALLTAPDLLPPTPEG